MVSNSESRILLTGAAGFIGHGVVPVLIAEGAEVMALTTKPKKVFEQWGIQTVDLLKVPENTILSRVKTFAPEVLLHLGWSGLPDYSADACLANVSSSIQVVRIALESGVSRIVGAGSCWEYGGLQGQLSEHLPTTSRSTFTQSKSCLRQLLESVEQDTGTQTRWARIFYAYGPGQREGSLIPLTIKAWRAGSAPDLRDTQSAIDLVHVQDVASGLAALTLRTGPSGIFNIGSGGATKVSDVVELIRAELIGEQDRESTSPMKDEATTAAWADIGAMYRDFGWTPKISLPEGIRIMLS